MISDDGKDRRMTFLGRIIYGWSEKDASLENVITAILHFNEPLDVKRVKDVIKSRMLCFERLHSVVSRDSSGHRYWKRIEYVDLNYHVLTHEDMVLSDRSAVDEFVTETYKMSMDPNRPLWQLHLVRLKGGKNAMIARFHHCIADGTTLVQLLFSLLDSQSKNATVVPKRATITWIDSLKKSPSYFALRLQRYVIGFFSGLTYLGHFKDTPNSLQLPVSKLGTIKRVCAGKESIPLEDLKQVAAKVDGTINDVIVAILTLSKTLYSLLFKNSSL